MVEPRHLCLLIPSSSGAASRALADCPNVYGHASAAVRENGGVITWGDPACGCDSSSVSSSLGSGVTSIVATERALAALKDDGSVAWGHASYGGDASSASSFLTSGVANISSTGYALAALKDDGCVVAWGFSSYGAPPSHLLASGVTSSGTLQPLWH